MSDSPPPSAELHVHKLLSEAQSKHTYFLLAAAASGIALAVTRTTGVPLDMTQLPLGGAVLAWGLSFYFGSRQLAYVMSTLLANTEYYRVRKGAHPEVGSHPQAIEAASQGIVSAMEGNSHAANRLAHLQFRLLILGALLFLTWHVLQMACVWSPAGASYS